MDYIIKRDGSRQSYQPEKIAVAIKKCFDATDIIADKTMLYEIVRRVEEKISLLNEERTVEQIQDAVEHALMENGYYESAKRYILYRQKRTEIRQSINSINNRIGINSLENVLVKIQNDYPEYSINTLDNKFKSFVKPDANSAEALSLLIKAAVELTTAEAPKWEYIAARLLCFKFHNQLSSKMEKHNISNFYDKIQYLTSSGLYGEYILSNYSKDDIITASSFIDNSRNERFTYSGLDLLLKRYVIQSKDHEPLETPQEMFLGIALHLAMNEQNNRMEWVKKFYDMLSTMRVTMATPTLSNARKPFHQLSSCFIDTVPDSLDGIYRSIDNFAQVSKMGGGMGMYLGKIRGAGSDIRGFEGAAGGVIRWIKLINDTAVAVDQLGMRQGAVAVYLDAWHKDLPEFLQLRTNNGDDRLKAHDVFPAICYPDLFWKIAKDNIEGDWHLMCPHEILTIKGYSLEDYYGEEWEKHYKDCLADPRIPKRTFKIKDIIRLILKSQVETGTPFVFNRDTVNKANPNGHKGIIYCSNLCTEIAQNMSAIQTVNREVKTEDGTVLVVTTTKPGDFVVCNLASLSLGNFDVEDEQLLKDTIFTVVRALDNVIDLNLYPTPYAQITNRSYRSLGLGISGYHHMLAKRNIKWESDEHLEFIDKLFEKINYYAIDASSSLAKERGSYKYFEGSDWQTGDYFEKRNYTDEKWAELAKKVSKGMRNAYLLAVAPTSSTSIISGTSAGTDPIMHKFFIEEKKGAMLPRVAPELSIDNYWYYKSAHTIDQLWSVRACGIRQRHIDQAQSTNFYITDDYTLRGLLNLYLRAWECGVKTVYYVRSKALEVEECESCAS